MSTRRWPTRAEWQANAERAVRTFCSMYERLPKGDAYLTIAEESEAADCAAAAVRLARPLLAVAIRDLRAELPDRPNAGRARINWFNGLDEDRYTAACNLAGLEEVRAGASKAAKVGRWGEVQWQLGRVRESYPQITVPAELAAVLDRLDGLVAVVAERRRTFAQALEDEAVVLEVARRATDEAWAAELERRAAVEVPRVIRVSG